ncbi:MAG: phosphate regulon sensor histidine kinase PhoR [Gammaproteobacteria bacterium]|nr:phosphate regulon sensor histidine kinase PhoR [Gammaproteobacteria bacterium]
MLTPDQGQKLAKLAVALILVALVGSWFDSALLFIVIALTVYVLMTLRNVFRLQNWLQTRKHSDIPEASGYWGELFNQLHEIEKERRVNRLKLTSALSRFQDAASALPDGTIILSKKNEIEWANASATNLLGIQLPRDEGLKIRNLLRNPKILEYMDKGDFSQPIVIHSPVKPALSLEISIIPFGSSQKLLLCRNITHVINLEEMRSNFIANVSHELRSPITVLLGYLETLLDMKAGSEPQVNKALTSMQEQAKRMDRLVSDLITLTKLETTPVYVHDQWVDVPAVLASVKEAADLMGAKKQQQISLEIDEHLKIKGNREELHSVFSNLVGNAVRYTPEGGSIGIRWSLAGDTPVFSVSDTGPGIAPQHLSRLTERFYRVDVDRSRETGGTGLGLAIVKHILDRHDARLDIQSTLGKGSTFSCYFPKPQNNTTQN